MSGGWRKGSLRLSTTTWDACRDFRESARKLMAGDHHRASGSETQVLAALARLGLVCEPQARTDVGYRCAGTQMFSVPLLYFAVAIRFGHFVISMLAERVYRSPHILVSTLRSATWWQSSLTVPCTMARILVQTARI